MSQLFLSVVLEMIGGFAPQKWRCAACLILQAASAVLLLHPAFGELVVSRVLGGFACALLHSSFEAWMVEQVWVLHGLFCLACLFFLAFLCGGFIYLPVGELRARAATAECHRNVYEAMCSVTAVVLVIRRASS